MKDILLALVAFVATNVLLYLGFAFIVWDFDPAQWSNGGRALFVVLGALLGMLSAVAATGGRV